MPPAKDVPAREAPEPATKPAPAVTKAPEAPEKPVAPAEKPATAADAQAAAWRAAGDAAKAAAAASGEPLPTLPESAVPLAAFRACACDLLTHRCLGCARAYCGDNPATAGCANIREDAGGAEIPRGKLSPVE